VKGTKRKDTVRIANALERIAADPQAKHTDRDTKDKKPFMCWVRVQLFVGEKRSQQAIAARRASPIQGFVGPNGGGKTACMVATTIPTLRGIRWECREPEHEHTKAGVYAGYRTVLSTVRILDPKTGEDHKLYRAFNDFDQLLAAEHCDVLMDEVVGIASSRESGSMDVRVQNVLVQLRRRDVVVRWTAPNWARADKIIREVTQSVTECRGYFSTPAVLDENGDVVGSLWRPKRLFSWRTYDTLDFEEWTAGKKEKLSATAKEWFYGVGSEVFDTYNTLGAVSRVASATANGLCATCNGRIPTKTCKCGDEHRSVVQLDLGAVAAELRAAA
jgi:hypothetical protein